MKIGRLSRVKLTIQMCGQQLDLNERAVDKIVSVAIYTLHCRFEHLIQSSFYFDEYYFQYQSISAQVRTN